MTARRSRLIFQGWCGVMVAALLVSAQIAAAQGAPTDVCVYLTGSGGKVSGLQMDLRWDPGCMTANSASGTAADCSSNASTGKNVQTRIFPDNSSMRVLFLSVSDKSAIPDDTELFCCKFAMVGSQTGSCCSVATSSIIFAGPTGSRVYDASAQLSVVVGGGAPCVSSGAGGSPSNPVQPPAAAIVEPPVVSAPGGAAPAAPAPVAPAPVMPRPNIPVQPPPVQGLPAEAPTPELAATAAVPSPEVTPAAAETSTAVQTAAPTTPPTPAPPTPTAPKPTPQIQGTPTGPVPSVTVKGQAATPPATTPTPKRKHKRHKKRGHAPHE
jgi:hypothetical protein